MLWITLGICTVSFAQIQIENSDQVYSQFDKEIPKDKTTWGVQAGLNYDNLFGKEIDYIFATDQASYKLGFHAGLFVDSRLGKNFGLKQELILSQRRTSVFLSDEAEQVYSTNFNRTYLDLMPLNFNYEKSGFQIYVGPYVSALLAAHVNRKDEDGKFFKDKSIYGDPENEESESRYLQKFDFGLNIGLAYKLYNKYSIGLRYMHGFTDLFQYANSYTNEDTKTDNIKIYNRGFRLTCGFNF